jgi:EmrB/QacA subfamily drug resistance transporter
MADGGEMRTARHGPALDREILMLGAVVVLGTFMTVLDLTIVNVAVPTLGRDFSASISTIQWVLTGYMLAFASVIPLAGWASERFGAKRLWLASLLLFMLGSALAGAAWSVGVLIGFRVLQGLGAGMLMPVGQTSLAQAAGPERMGRVMSVVSLPGLLAPVLGPVVGGALLGHASWRWIFFINLPVGFAAVVTARRLLPDAKPRLGERLDLRGLLLLSPGLAIFLYGVSEAGNGGGFGDARAIATVAVGLALVALFVWHASVRGARALLDLSLFRRRGFAMAAAANLLLGVALFGSLILLPLYYQAVRHESALQTGLLLAPQGLGVALVMPLAGWLTDTVGARLVVSVGTVAALIGTLAYTQVGADPSYLYLAAALLVIGIGLGSTIMPSMAAAFQTLAREETPRATSAINVIQRVAGAIGTALLAIILQREIARNVPNFQGGLQGIGGPSRTPHGAALLADAFGTTFWVAAGLTAAALAPALLLPSTRLHQQVSESRASSGQEGRAA